MIRHDAPTRPEEALTPAVVDDLVERYTALWWAGDTSLPPIGPIYSPRVQAANERHLDTFLGALADEMGLRPRDETERQAAQERICRAFARFTRAVLETDERALDMLFAHGFVDAAATFAHMARRFDPAIEGADIYQAGRNVWMANFVQLLLGLPVRVTPAIFAYSLLYPYTDNYLDDPAIDTIDKLAFNARFRRRLAGEPIAPRTPHERLISDLVGMIETQFARACYPQVFASLLAIHQAQGHSLLQAQHKPSRHAINVVGISIEKGGTSVLADGYLAAGSLSEGQRATIFSLGVLTQLMDDLEDLPQNLDDGFMTIFSQTAGQGMLEPATNRALHLYARILEQLDGFGTADLAPFKGLIKRCIYLLFIEAAGQSARHYPGRYLRELERYSPFQLAALRRRRRQLARRRLSPAQLIDMFATTIPREA